MDQPRTTRSGQDHLQREIDATDRQIDQLVYELYGLTDVGESGPDICHSMAQDFA